MRFIVCVVHNTNSGGALVNVDADKSARALARYLGNFDHHSDKLVLIFCSDRDKSMNVAALFPVDIVTTPKLNQAK